MSTDKKILYLYMLQDALDSLARFRNDIKDALSNGINNSVKISLNTERPLYFGRNANNCKKIKGNINNIQIGSNVVDYTTIFEFYNFTENDHQMRVVAQKLKAIFSLKVSCFIGLNRKADYTMLQN